MNTNKRQNIKIKTLKHRRKNNEISLKSALFLINQEAGNNKCNQNTSLSTLRVLPFYLSKAYIKVFYIRLIATPCCCKS